MLAEARAQKLHSRTFAQCVDAYLDQHSSTWRNDKHRRQWRSTLNIAVDAFGDLDVRVVDTAMIVGLLTPIWAVLHLKPDHGCGDAWRRFGLGQRGRTARQREPGEVEGPPSTRPQGAAQERASRGISVGDVERFRPAAARARQRFQFGFRVPDLNGGSHG